MPEMVVLVQGQTALSVAALQYALRQGHRGRYAVLAHLLHRKIGILFCVLLVLAHIPFRLSVHTS